MTTRQVLYLIGFMVVLIVVIALTGAVTLFVQSIIPVLFLILILAVTCLALFGWLLYVRFSRPIDKENVSKQ
jgi:hypothetical protein